MASSEETQPARSDARHRLLKIATVAGAAIAVAARKIDAKARKIAAHLLEVGENDLDWAIGRFNVKGDSAHQALPYDGLLDRLIVSFNASAHAAQGSDRLHRYSAA